MKAQTLFRMPVTRDLRTAKQGNAREAIGTLTPGCELYVLTFGQFSLIDALAHLIEQTGPAEVVLATWTAADADLTKAAGMIEDAEITRMRVIVDQSFMQRANAVGLAHTLRRLFGDACIRTTRTHAKFAAIRNDKWTLAVRTSMNLNTNPRLENLEISDDPALCGFLEAIADDLFAEQKQGTLAGGLPELASLDNIKRPGQVETGRVRQIGERVVPAPRVRNLNRASIGAPQT